MADVNVSFCSPLHEHGELYAALEELFDLYHEGEPIEEVQFERDAEADHCTALHVAVADEFTDALREDIAETIRAHHDCQVVVGEYEDGADFVHGSCQIE